MGMGDGGSRSEARGEARAGALTLSLLATPHSVPVLEELSHGPRRLSELRHQLGSPSQAALRDRLEQLQELGAVTRRWRNPLRSGREYELTAVSGRELLFVATTTEGWLASAPDRPLRLGTAPGQAAVAALAESWSSATPRAPAGNGNPARPSDWLRKGAGPIAAAIRWEQRHAPGLGAPPRPGDAETGFLLAVPLVKPAPDLAGSCRLAVEFGDGAERRLAGATVEVADGRVVSCTTRLEDSPAAWATGPPEAWLRTAIEADPDRLELGGDRRLVRGLVDGLNQVLFGPARPLPEG